MSDAKRKHKRKRKAKKLAERIKLPIGGAISATQDSGSHCELITEADREHEGEGALNIIVAKAKESTITDWLLAAFTLALTVTAIYQYKDTDRQLDVMRNDERAWIKVTPVPEEDHHLTSVDDTRPISFLLKITNFGKSPATNVKLKAYIEIPNHLREPRLECVDGNIECPHIEESTGSLFPNDSPERRIWSRTIKDPARDATLEEMTSWNAGTAYAAAYGIVTYDDVFGIQRSTKWCFSDPGTTIRLNNADCANFTEAK
jgi:hypothetical protein